jgi:hypothetical protein
MELTYRISMRQLVEALMTENVLKLAKNELTTRRAKFVQLAESRTTTAIKAIRVIGKLGNRNAYDFDEADVRKIAKALIDEVEALKSRMKTTKSADGIDFKL